MTSSRTYVRDLYRGSSSAGRIFRLSMLIFDTAALVYFISSSLLRDAPWIFWVDGVIATVIIADLVARFWIAPTPLAPFREIATYADFIVVATLIAPAFFDSFLFLRVLRALRVFQSYRVLTDLRDEFAFFRHNEDVIKSVVNLIVFVFVMSSLVFVLQAQTNTKIVDYLDALYFTVSALSTTGFGDITLEGRSGRVLSILILLIGVGLFLRLVQTIFRPSHVHFECPKCGLTRHDTDAVHCKHCGRTLHIETEGAD